MKPSKTGTGLLNPRVILDIHSANNLLKGGEVVGREFAFVGESLEDIIRISELNLLEDRPVNIFGKFFAIPSRRKDRRVHVGFDFSRIRALARESTLYRTAYRKACSGLPPKMGLAVNPNTIGRTQFSLAVGEPRGGKRW